MIDFLYFLLLTLVTLGCFTGCEPLGGGPNRPPTFKDNEWFDIKI